MSSPLLFVTSNQHKLREAEEILGRSIQGVPLELEEIQSASLEEVVRRKTVEAFRGVGRPVMVEDTALTFEAWGGLPGTFIKHFLQALGAGGLAKTLAVSDSQAAQALSGVGYHDGWRVHYFQGATDGTIVHPCGTGGFGWDPIFLPEGSGRTFAEMTPREKYACSMRARALGQMAEWLANG